jgi:hypothetical protein
MRPNEEAGGMAGWQAWAAVVSGLVVAAPVWAAEDLGTGRRVQGTVGVEAVPVEDVEGHVLGVVEFGGLTFFANGEIAPHRNVSTFDLTDGEGPHSGYVLHRFVDGSTSAERYTGAVRIDGESGRSIVEGTFECSGGTGRFVGIEGGGTYRGERFGSLEAGQYLYIDFTGSCAVP